MSQSAKKIRGDFPPSSRETFFRLESAQDLGIVITVMIGCHDWHRHPDHDPHDHNDKEVCAVDDESLI